MFCGEPKKIIELETLIPSEVGKSQATALMAAFKVGKEEAGYPVHVTDAVAASRGLATLEARDREKIGCLQHFVLFNLFCSVRHHCDMHMPSWT